MGTGLVKTFRVVHHLENQGIANPIVRLTDTNADINSPQFTHFVELLDPELVEVRKLFNPDLYEEAARVSSWKELLQKVAGGEEVENDTSFLKLPFFRPTLLSLQAKFQQLASSLDGPDENSTSSLHSSHSSPHTSLVAHLDSSLRTISSSSHFKQESLQLLNILHSLLTSPLPPSLPTHHPPDIFASGFTIFEPDDDISPRERFHSSLFDEADDEKLTRSLHRCHSVCRLVGTKNCILDIPEFFDRTVSVLSSSNNLLRAAAFSLFISFFDTTAITQMLPHLWDRLRSAFRDGQLEEQFALLRISTEWIVHQVDETCLHPFPASDFDWDGLLRADLRETETLIYSLILIEYIWTSSITDKFGKAKATYIILSFEQHQNAVTRIVSLFEDTRQMEALLGNYSLVSYCLLISLLSNRDFPPTLTNILTKHPENDEHHLALLHENVLFLLCHSSLNPHKPHQPPLDLLFERTLRMHPHVFFTSSSDPNLDFSPNLLDTALCGFHALCRRGVHVDLMEAEVVRCGKHLVNSLCLFITPLISDPFISFSISLHHSSFVSSFPFSLLTITAPFGDCHSVRELFRSVDKHDDISEDSSLESIVISHCQALERLNIPTGFGSALAHSNTHDTFYLFEDRIKPSISLDESLSSSHLPSTVLGGLSEEVNNTRTTVSDVGDLIRDLTPDNVEWILNSDPFLFCYETMLSPIPAVVSVNLEFVRRAVCLTSVGNRMEMVRFGMLEIVIRGVSESSFLEDYDNGICVIGILLRSIRDLENEEEMEDHDFSRLLSQTGLS
ncbi:hypothetical protein BLNAU_1279 [Blattamonas nauphoetae]|uniref:Uncharacterized protein n=1 Tax=Blattamonas nauphoetae TaxID=2049346 RepID=A0ABQ9YJ06_9EUKA|nr:hypothetical protein BLNAU_1279 [Blattamonas nauphoetae]